MITSFSIEGLSIKSFQKNENLNPSSIDSKLSNVLFIHEGGEFHISEEVDMVVVKSTKKSILFIPIVSDKQIDNRHNIMVKSKVIEFKCLEGEHTVRTQNKDIKINEYLLNFALTERLDSYKLISYGKNWILI